MTGYLRNQRRKGYPRQHRAMRDVSRGFRVLARAASDAGRAMRDLTAAFSAVRFTKAER